MGPLGLKAKYKYANSDRGMSSRGWYYKTSGRKRKRSERNKGAPAGQGGDKMAGCRLEGGTKQRGACLVLDTGCGQVSVNSVCWLVVRRTRLNASSLLQDPEMSLYRERHSARWSDRNSAILGSYGSQGLAP